MHTQIDRFFKYFFEKIYPLTCLNREAKKWGYFEKKFKNAHMPVKDHFFFLCPNCHSKYDNGILKDIDIRP